MLMYWDDVANDYSDWCRLLKQFGAEMEDEEEAVWGIARQYGYAPHFGNIRQHILLERLAVQIKEKWPQSDVEIYINARDTHFNVNGENVSCLHDLGAP